MKRGQQSFDSRSEAARRRKPCSKIEAKLRLRRRSKLDNKIDKSSRESPKILRKNYLESPRSFEASSTENDSPKFFTSKEHVELVDFESKRIASFPRLQKSSKKSLGTPEKIGAECEEKGTRKTRKSLSQTIVKKENYVRRTFTDAQIFKHENRQVNFIVEENDPRQISRENGKKSAENLQRNSKHCVKSANQEFTFPVNKKRSRSAPCTPLFKIKCAKEKCSRNSPAERKSLAGKLVKEEIRKLRKNRSKELRISRSGEVAVNMFDTLSEERIIERSSLEAFQTQEKRPENVLTAENLQFKKNEYSESINGDNLKNIEAKKCQKVITTREIISEENLPEEIIFSEKKQSEIVLVTENLRFKENEDVESINGENLDAEICKKKFTTEAIISQINLLGEIILNKENSASENKDSGEENTPKVENLYFKPETFKAELNITIEEKGEKDFCIKKSAEIVKSVSRAVEEEKKEKIPQKPPKKRAFKWETILEKQHRQLIAPSPENCKNTSEILAEEQKDNKFDFWSEKIASCSKHCRCPRSRGKFLENRRLEAYNIIRAELPKILMKRRQAEAAKFTGSRIQTAQSNKSPETQKKAPKPHNCLFNAPVMKNIVRRYGYENNFPSKNSPKQLSPKKKNNLRKDCDFPLKSQTPYNRPKIFEEVKNINPETNFAESPRIFEELSENKCNRIHRVSILKHRKTPSPRRVTFRLPGRVIDDYLSEDESNFVENFNQNEEAENCSSENNFSKNCQENLTSHNNEDKIVKEEENSGRKKMERDENLFETCSLKKARELSKKKLPTVEDSAKMAQHVRWISPRLFPGEKEQYCCVSEESEQDWETPTGEDVYLTPRDVRFPRETREAMKILLRARENTLKRHGDQKMTGREISWQRDPHSRVANSPEKSSTIVSKSYAKALAKFQEGCDIEVQENVFRMPTTSAQLRGSRKANEAGGK